MFASAEGGLQDEIAEPTTTNTINWIVHINENETASESLVLCGCFVGGGVGCMGGDASLASRTGTAAEYYEIECYRPMVDGVQSG